MPPGLVRSRAAGKRCHDTACTRSVATTFDATTACRPLCRTCGKVRPEHRASDRERPNRFQSRFGHNQVLEETGTLQPIQNHYRSTFEDFHNPWTNCTFWLAQRARHASRDQRSAHWGVRRGRACSGIACCFPVVDAWCSPAVPLHDTLPRNIPDWSLLLNNYSRTALIN